jgi:cytochrome aa3-600 menaquinol oxidase subunit 1
VRARDAWWDMKEHGQSLARSLKPQDIRGLKLPKNTPAPFLLGFSFFVFGFGAVFEWWMVAALGALGVVAVLFYSAFDSDEWKHVSADEIRETELELGRLGA